VVLPLGVGVAVCAGGALNCAGLCLGACGGELVAVELAEVLGHHQ
jgi:hypothetical protein